MTFFETYLGTRHCCSSGLVPRQFVVGIGCEGSSALVTKHTFSTLMNPDSHRVDERYHSGSKIEWHSEISAFVGRTVRFALHHQSLTRRNLCWLLTVELIADHTSCYQLSVSGKLLDLIDPHLCRLRWGFFLQERRVFVIFYSRIQGSGKKETEPKEFSPMDAPSLLTKPRTAEFKSFNDRYHVFIKRTYQI